DFVLATSGDKGSRDPSTSGAQLAASREREQLASAAVLGAGPGGFFPPKGARPVGTPPPPGGALSRILRRPPDGRPSCDPAPAHREHPDHRVVGRVALDAAWPCARDPLTYPEMGPPHETAEAWLFGSTRGTRADLRVDVREVLELKIAARLEHRSQTRDPVDMARRWRRVAGQERFLQGDLR